jgi:Alcohol dehydrogenase GroES-like domain
VPGHETVGKVVKLGAGVTGFAVGDRVCSETRISKDIQKVFSFPKGKSCSVVLTMKRPPLPCLLPMPSRPRIHLQEYGTLWTRKENNARYDHLCL